MPLSNHQKPTRIGCFIWSSEDAAMGRNVSVLFVREFTLEAAVESARIALFADSRYVLRVNGAWVASGPGRFMPARPRHDEWELGPHLRAGANRIEVLVNAPHSSTFQTDPASRGGFAAGGGIRTESGFVSLETPGAWRCRLSHAWRSSTPAFSFALGPTEACDLRVLREEREDPGFSDPVPVADGPWGEPEPMDVAPPDFRLVPAAGISGPAVWAKSERVMVFCLPGAGREKPPRHVVKIWVRAPRAGVFSFGSLWLHPSVNGVPIRGTADAVRGARTNYEAEFNEGWNLLTGYVDALAELWTVQLAFEVGDGLEISATRRPGDRHALAVSKALTNEQAARLTGGGAVDAEALAGENLEWTAIAPDWTAGAPARRMAWAAPEARLPAMAPFRRATPAAPIDARRGVMAVLDWGRPFPGHLHLEIEAPRGAVLDVAWAETLRADGCVTLYPGNPRIESADRFILEGGRQVVDGFAVRGGRYVQINVDLPDGGEGGVVLHRAAIRSVQIPLADTGRFSCDDPLWNWVWSTGRATLEGCMEDVYVDCPWRERGLYIADAWADARLQRLFSADPAITRHCLRLIAEGQLPNGQLNAVAPSWYQTSLEDFSLTWILFLRDHWAWTGDAALVRELWPAVKSVLGSRVWREGASGLWDVTKGMHPFIDWGATAAAKSGRGNACLNAFRAEAFFRAAELAREIGQEEDARRFGVESARVRAAFSERLFDGETGRFRCSLDENPGEADDSIHGNVLALAFGLGTADQRGRVLEFVLAQLERVSTDPLDGPAPKFELFFLNYVLDVLYDAGEAEAAERVVRAFYGPMHGQGATTFWETLSRGGRQEGSQCHAWSGAATLACVTRILGVRPAVPGRTDKYLISPQAAGISRAEGVFPHPLGEIRVAWTKDATGLRTTVSGPEGVELAVEERDASSLPARRLV